MQRLSGGRMVREFEGLQEAWGRINELKSDFKVTYLIWSPRWALFTTVILMRTLRLRDNLVKVTQQRKVPTLGL